MPVDRKKSCLYANTAKGINKVNRINDIKHRNSQTSSALSVQYWSFMFSIFSWGGKIYREENKKILN
jgi:hypothetical protein